MRAPFAYELDASLLQRIFVPDLLTLEEWTGLRETLPHGHSLLQWICHTYPAREEALLLLLSDAAGHPDQVPWTGDDTRVTGAEARILRANGFTVLGPNRVCGGPALPPDLYGLLGPASQNWKWCLVGPLDPPPTATNRPPTATTFRPSVPADPGPEPVLWEALSRGARDIHFERHGSDLTVRFHTGAVMVTLGTWGPPVADRWIRLLKHMGGLHPDGQVLPEDGRIELGDGREQVPMRLGRIPTVNGESLVLRLTGDSGGLPEPAALGVPNCLHWALLDAVANDPGLILFCGITGSGKTTTACSLLRDLGCQSLKIVTIEDPVEYILPGVQQSSVDVDSGWTFETALRAYLRQDPDVILLGEIRDAESARMACRAALTGHSVLATLHAGSIPAAMDRLAAWQISAPLLLETVRLIVHQRLAFPQESGTPQACFSWETACSLHQFGRVRNIPAHHGTSQPTPANKPIEG